MERTSETWAKRVERWKDSGLTASEFAREIGVSARSLTWWSWRLQAEANGYQARKRQQAATPEQRVASKESADQGSTQERIAIPKRRRPRENNTRSSMTFVEMPGLIPNDRLEIILPSSVRIAVQRNFDAATLERLLEVLDRRR